MPKVSVIVPVYGVEKYIERCVRNLFEQTLNDIEYIFVDDCTPDKSIEILNSIIEEYRLRLSKENKVVRIERKSTNSGLPAARRHGLQFATGSYILHCDSDDWVDKDMLRQMYNTAVKEQSDCVVCDYFVTDTITEKIIKGTNTTDKYCIISEILSDKIAGSLWNKLFSRRLYEQELTYPTGSMAEDVATSVQLLYYADKVSYIPSPFYYYYVNNGSITRMLSREKAIINFRAATGNAQIVINFIKSKGLSERFKKELILFKFREKGFLVPYLEDDEINKMWRNTFPEVNVRMLFMNVRSIREKIKYMLFLCHVLRSF